MAKIGLSRIVSRALLCLLFASFDPFDAVGQQADALYGQATSARLQRNFSSPGTEYLLLDLRAHRTVATHWLRPDEAMPVGSLLKPFVALAYGQTLGEAARLSFPSRFVVRCRGKIDGCWKPGGHGSLTLESAVAQSCNAYFLALAGALSGEGGLEQVRKVSTRYGLAPPPDLAGPQALIGLTSDWRLTPLALADAYGRLANDAQDPIARSLVRGMRLAALPGGTGAKIGTHPGGVLAKTGTAPCRESSCVASGDGLAMLLAPAEEPRLLLLVRRRGTTGAQAAAIAGRMLTELEGPHAR